MNARLAIRLAKSAPPAPMDTIKAVLAVVLNVVAVIAWAVL